MNWVSFTVRNGDQIWIVKEHIVAMDRRTSGVVQTAIFLTNGQTFYTVEALEQVLEKLK